MSVQIRREGETVVAVVEGQLIAANKQQLRDALNLEIDAGARAFVIDFADTGYIDSAGLGTLVSLAKKVRDARGSLRLTNLNSDLRTLLELTRLDRLFEFGDGPDDGGAGVAVTPPLPPPLQSQDSRPDDGARI